MLKSKIESALNKQLNDELASSHIYLSIAAYFESINYPGFAHWMKSQAAEEHGHAMKLYGYLTQRGGKVLLSGIEEPKHEWASIMEAFEYTFAHEQKITASIYALVDLAIEEKDHATRSFLSWFIQEQVEEEATVEAIEAKLKRLGSTEQGLYLLDREMGARTN